MNKSIIFWNRKLYKRTLHEEEKPYSELRSVYYTHLILKPLFSYFHRNHDDNRSFGLLIWFRSIFFVIQCVFLNITTFFVHFSSRANLYQIMNLNYVQNSKKIHTQINEKKNENEYSYSKLEEIHIKILWVCASYRVLNKRKKIISIFTSTKYRIVWKISNIWHLKNVKCNKLCYFRHVLNQLSQQSWHCVFFACRESDPSIEKSHF